MNVCIATYQSVMMLKGGPKTQLLQTKAELERLGVNITLFDSWNNFDKSKFDLVHLFGANIGTYHLAKELHKLGVPIVVSPIFFSLHSTRYLRGALTCDSLLRNVFKGFWIDYGFLRDICQWARAVVPNTHNEARLLIEGIGIPSEKITVVPNGVEERFIHADKSLFIQTYGKENFILNVGHIGPERKNVLTLITVLAELDRDAVIIGRIEDTPSGRQCVVEAKKNPRILMLDSIPNDSPLLASAYAASDTFVLPSLFETPGIAALEAALAGSKIVITKHGGTVEYFGDHADYVDPKSPADIRRGIEHALGRTKSNDLREHIHRMYLWSSVAKKTLSVYQQVCA
jgi:glycosyltransferase involved in cell wall biosynthesis